MQVAIAVFASARRDGNTGRLMDRVAADLNIEVIDIGQQRILPFDYEHRNRDDDFEPTMERILQFDSIIFASPIYWYSVCSAMKTFVDRLSDLLEVPDLLAQGRRLRGKTGYVVCTSVYDAPARSFLDLFEDTFRYLGVRFGGYLHANCEQGYVADRYETDVRAFVGRVRSSGSVRQLDPAMLPANVQR